MIAWSIYNGSPVNRQKSPLEEDVWLMPAGAVDVEPPAFDTASQTCSWDGSQWVVADIPVPEPDPTPEPIPAIDQLRQQRNALLAETDWWCLSDQTPTQAQLDYRQALRDLPSNCTPALDETGQLTGVEWPVKPQ